MGVCGGVAMGFVIDANTEVIYKGEARAVINGAGILRRDIGNCFKKVGKEACKESGRIILQVRDGFECEDFLIEVGEDMRILASDDLGFVYGLLYISEKFLGIKPFWFWMDQKIDEINEVRVPCGSFRGIKAQVKYRGWFVNDEVLIMKWKINGDADEPWRMVFEVLLRCGGNMVIPGTDTNSRKYRQMASDMGLWITHHHAEPLGAEMFSYIYPDKEANYMENASLFRKLWEDAIMAQKDLKVIWCLGFRGQGDCPFWSNDTSGEFDTPQKRGRLISDIIREQKEMIKRQVSNPVFCTNLYGEITELYDEGFIDLDEDIIRISADNGYGKMVTRRRDNHTVRISSLPKIRLEHGGIYYHASFYDLQGASHITMLSNSVDFVENELEAIVTKNATDFWMINCSNVRPHVYFLDAIRRKWYGEHIGDDVQSKAFVRDYYISDKAEEDKLVADIYRDYPKAMLSYGVEEDEHAGEQFYTENVRILVHGIFNNMEEGTPSLHWLVGKEPLDKQISDFTDLARKNLDNIESFYHRCCHVSCKLEGCEKQLFDSTIFMQVSIHFYCTKGVVAFGDGCKKYYGGNLIEAFVLLGDSSRYFYEANKCMGESEHGVWKGFYYNDCFADIKHTAYMVEKLMGFVRECGDNARHDKWYKKTAYAPARKGVFSLLVLDNHMTDWELYEAFKEMEK